MVRWVILGLAACSLALTLWLWFSPMGVGEYKESPDGRWEARVMSMHRGTWRGTRQSFLMISVESVPKGTYVWKTEWDIDSTARLPDYGNRQFQFIHWAANSTEFSVELTNGLKTTIPLAVLTNPSIQIIGGRISTNGIP
jgi:hypothetical protein